MRLMKRLCILIICFILGLAYQSPNVFAQEDAFILEYEVVSQTFAGPFNSAAITEDHKVFMWGNNQYGQIADDGTPRKLVPTDMTNRFDLEALDYIVNIEISEFIIALSHHGKVFGWGRNQNYQLGLGHVNLVPNPQDLTPMFDLLEDEKVIDIKVGGLHTVLLTNLGRIMAWGDNFHGQIGTPSPLVISTPLDITAQFNLLENEKILAIEAGDLHNLALTSHNRLFVWGNYIFGRLGFPTSTDQKTPHVINDFLNLNEDESIHKIEAGGFHTAILTTKNRVFTWGYNAHGALGDQTTVSKDVATDITNRFDFNDPNDIIIDITLGGFHSGATSLYGQVFVWGHNQTGALGLGHNLDQNKPISIDNKLLGLNLDIGLTDITLGMQHTIIQSSDGKIFIFGYNNQGQLGLNHITSRNLPQAHFKQIFHIEFFLSEDNIVILSGYKDDELHIPDALFLEGYTFLSWVFSSGDPFDLTAFIEENIKVSPLYEPLMYAIVFDSMLGSDVDLIEALYLSPIEKPEDPTRIGYEFMGWYESLTFDVLFDFDVMPLHGITLYAKWEMSTFTFAFYVFDEMFDVITKTFNAPFLISEIENPYREGYTFIRWSPTPPNAFLEPHMRFDAVFRLNSYTIELRDFDDQLIIRYVKTFQTDLTDVFMPQMLVKQGYTFLGWDQELPRYMPAQNLIIRPLYLKDSLQIFNIENQKNYVYGTKIRVNYNYGQAFLNDQMVEKGFEINKPGTYVLRIEDGDDVLVYTFTIETPVPYAFLFFILSIFLLSNVVLFQRTFILKIYESYVNHQNKIIKIENTVQTKEILIENLTFQKRKRKYVFEFLNMHCAKVNHVTCDQDVMDKFLYYNNHISQIFNKQDLCIYQRSEKKIFSYPIHLLGVSQFYISVDKLNHVLTFIKEEKDIICPVVVLDNKYVLTDGHTRLKAAEIKGYEIVYIYLDDDNDDLSHYVSAARKKGLYTIKDVPIISKDRYERLWIDFCKDFEKTFKEDQ